MTRLIGVPFSMILGIVAPYATLRQAPVPRTAGDSTVAYDALLFAGGGMYGQIPAYLNERFPTEVRATATGFCFHVGAIAGAIGM